MSESKARVVVDFNKKSNGSTIRIPYGLHVIHRVLIGFDKY